MSAAKRVFDVCASAFALALFSPVLLVSAAWIRAHDGGPVLFRQERVGRGGAPFTILKLRTMQDEVVTGPGRWLRATGLDEVPQFVNVLRGDMSVVGPRPLTRADLQRLGFDRAPERASVRPGVTGPAQVFAPRTPAQVLDTDVRYARAQQDGSLAIDAELVAWSFAMNVLGKQRVRGWLAGHRLAPART